MKKEIFKKGMALLLQAFPNKEISPEIAWCLLSDLKDEEFEKAVIDIISTKVEIYPNTNMIALIREKAKKNTERITAGEAWAIVLGAVSSVGSYRFPDFKDNLIDRAVSCVGWKDICRSENIGVERAHFLKVYESLARREDEQLVGLPNLCTKLLENKI